MTTLTPENKNISLPEGKHVLVVGLSRSGLAAVRVLKRMGFEVMGTDSQSSLPEATQKELDALAVKAELGPHKAQTFLQADWIVISPGVPSNLPVLLKARKAGKPIFGELELAFRLAPQSKFIAITGTNGKSTTTMMVSKILEAAKIPHLLGGNIGMPLADRLEPLPSIVVAEVSSFQLEEIQNFRPTLGAILNLAPDHLDRYPDYASYIEAKARLCMNMRDDDCLIYNAEDPYLAKMVQQRWPHLKKQAFHRRKDFLGFEQDNQTIKVMPVSELSVRGIHNIENAQAAIAITALLKVPVQAMAQALRTYEPLPHRCQLVGTVQGVRFYDDSKGTNVGATLMTLGGFDEPLILIAGGRAKGDDYEPLANFLQPRARHAILIGEAKEGMASAFKDKVPYTLAESMEQATALALEKAKSGDAVVLSPACSSFDMFHDYHHRGEVFRKSVELLASKAGATP